MQSLPVSFNDVDYCARMRAKGYRIVQANSVSLFHFESKTRSGGAHEWEVRRSWAAWLRTSSPRTPTRGGLSLSTRSDPVR